jgi:predicted small lipoprotein YifL
MMTWQRAPAREMSFVKPTLCCLILLALAGCGTPDPLRSIPAHERTMLEAEARQSTNRDRRSTVDAMLARARANDPGPLALRFTGDATTPDAAQREAMTRFAAAARGAPRLLVQARAGGGAEMLAPRRAIAVARLLEPDFPQVDIQFDLQVPADTVRILLPTERSR